MAKQRADLLIVERGLADTRSLAQRLVMAGQVRADGQVVLKPASLLDEGVRLEIIAGPKYVSRGGDKLAAALAAFPVVVPGAACADAAGCLGPTIPARDVSSLPNGVTAEAGLTDRASSSGIAVTPAALRQSRRFMGATLPAFPLSPI